MFRESYDYYVDRIGKHPNSLGWGLLQFDVLAHFRPFEHQDWIAPRPLLMIAGTEADTRHFSEDAVALAGPTAELFDIEGASHMDLYYKDPFVLQAVAKLTDFYNTNLKGCPPPPDALAGRPTAVRGAGHRFVLAGAASSTCVDGCRARQPLAPCAVATKAPDLPDKTARTGQRKRHLCSWPDCSATSCPQRAHRSGQPRSIGVGPRKITPLPWSTYPQVRSDVLA